MAVPADRHYLQSHEWHKTEGDTITIGITQSAADELTDITYVELPAVGKHVEANQPFGTIESVKATSDLYSGISGTVVAVNDRLNGEPGLVNTSPFEEAWMIKVKPDDAGAPNNLLTADQYQQQGGH